MKKIFMAGFTVIFAFGVLVLFFKLVAVDLLANIFRPLILLIADEWLVVPLTVILTVILIFLVGIPASQIKFQGIIIKLLERMLPKDKRGALVERSKGVYDLVIIIKNNPRN